MSGYHCDRYVVALGRICDKPATVHVGVTHRCDEHHPQACNHERRDEDGICRTNAELIALSGKLRVTREALKQIASCGPSTLDTASRIARRALADLAEEKGSAK